jgi:conjugal transfer pilus assembly protein TrbC
MTRSLLAALTCTALLAGAMGGALAQSAAPELDLGAIRKRAEVQASDAEALATTARKRAEAVSTEASQSAEGAKANGDRYAGATPPPTTDKSDIFDFEAMVADRSEMAKADMGSAPRFIAFASLSMPKAALQQMLADVSRAGGVVVFRGLTQGSGRLMTEALGKVLRPGEPSEALGIDPRLFRAFAIEAVPAYVVTASDFDLCDGLDCTSTVPPFDQVSGNVSAEFALDTIAEGGGPGARIAAQHRSRLQGQLP